MWISDVFVLISHICDSVWFALHTTPFVSHDARAVVFFFFCFYVLLLTRHTNELIAAQRSGFYKKKKKVEDGCDFDF